MTTTKMTAAAAAAAPIGLVAIEYRRSLKRPVRSILPPISTQRRDSLSFSFSAIEREEGRGEKGGRHSNAEGNGERGCMYCPSVVVDVHVLIVRNSVLFCFAALLQISIVGRFAVVVTVYQSPPHLVLCSGRSAGRTASPQARWCILRINTYMLRWLYSQGRTIFYNCRRLLNVDCL